MNSTLIRRMRGLWVALALVLAAGAVGTATVSAAAPSAQVSALTKAQKKAKAKALKKCKKQRAGKRKACIKKVNKKYAKLARKAKPKGKTYSVDVADNYYAPSVMNLKVNDSILWNWKKVAGREPHNVGLVLPLPRNVSSFDFQSDLTSDQGYTFRRKFTRPGSYYFQCSLHVEMKMTVQVKK